jgi:hypothetical protein
LETNVDASSAIFRQSLRCQFERFYDHKKVRNSYQAKIIDFAASTKSFAAIEIIYMQVRWLIVTYENLQIPPSLIEAYFAVFRKRREWMEGVDKRGAFDSAYSAELQQVKNAHTMFFNAKEMLVNTTHARA